MNVIPAPGQARGERGIFRKESVAGMNRVAVGVARDAQNLFDDQIAFARRRGADGIGFIGQPHVERGAIHVAIHRNGAHTEFAAGAHDAHCDFTAIGNQDFLEHFRGQTEREF